jgi:hypothetical protein
MLISRDGAVLRMLGRICSAKHRDACPGGQRGDLLGAFTYWLKPQAD